MKVISVDTDPSWGVDANNIRQYLGTFVATIKLTPDEWPEFRIDNDTWLERPVRKWVVNNLGRTVFCFDGTILFYNQADYDWFRFRWTGVYPVEFHENN